jgi:ADP-heptose:LPS heptosyltransferase
METLVLKLIEQGYCVAQGGAETDWAWFDDWDISEGFPVDANNFKRVNHLSLFDQIKIALECDLCIGTDSGSALVLGAYKIPQISKIIQKKCYVTVKSFIKASKFNER